MSDQNHSQARPFLLREHLSAPMSMEVKKVKDICLTGGAILLLLFAVSCNGQDYGILQPTPEDLCKCLPIEPDISDYRHLAKQIPIPDLPNQEVTVETRC